MNGIIINQEVRALSLHQRLFRRLGDRRDILSTETLSAALQRGMQRLLVAGLDYDAEPGTGGLPLPTGGRYRKLCFSPLIQELALTSLAHLGVHQLPTTEHEYFDYVQLTTGIGPDCAEALERLYRLDVGWLFHKTAIMREESPHAWRLLLSNEFTLAAKAWPALSRLVAGERFKHPLIDGFKFFAEVERGSLVMRHIARASEIVDRPRLLNALQSQQPLALHFSKDELGEVYRLLDYASFSTEAVRNFLFDLQVEDMLALPNEHVLWAAASESLPTKLNQHYDNPAFRKSMLGAFALPPRSDGAPDRRRGMLRDDQIVRWYGMTNEVLPVLVLEGARYCLPIRKDKAVSGLSRFEDHRPALAKLAGALRQAWDPKCHKAVEDEAQRYTRTANCKRPASEKEVTLEGNIKLGSKLAKTYLPSPGRLGSAARFHISHWGRPYEDMELWALFLGDTRPIAKHNIARPERQHLKTSMTVLGRAFGSVFKYAKPSSENLEIACQMAVSYSAISSNPQIAFSIARLNLCPDRRQRLRVRERGAQ